MTTTEQERERKMDFVSDRSVFTLRRRFPSMLSFYEGSTAWIRDNERCGWVAPEGTKGFFQTVNGPWPA